MEKLAAHLVLLSVTTAHDRFTREGTILHNHICVEQAEKKSLEGE